MYNQKKGEFLLIEQNSGIFNLSTQSTTYLFGVNKSGHLEHLYYGEHLCSTSISLDALSPILTNPLGIGIAYSETDPSMLEIVKQEISTPGKGDYRESAIELSYNDGMDTLDFIYSSHQILKGKSSIFTGLPQSYGDNTICDTLRITLKEKELKLRLILTYTTFNDCDVITRKATLYNDSPAEITIQNLASLQLDLDDSDWDLTTFDGAWARERHINRRPLTTGILINDSKSGVSSADHNPCIFLSRKDCNELHGECLATNLIYSGNHREAVEVSPYGQTRVLTGINSAGFRWKLAQDESFTTPEAILTYSNAGFSDLSKNLHYFANNHIVRGYWKNKQRPILINNWEATYFNFTESKLITLAKRAKEVGIELFVLDDGWFGDRQDDTSSLGDWSVNTKKLTSGMGAFAQKLHEMNLLFGLWVEPEMISRNSNLFDKHPDWAVIIPGRAPSVGRNQFILDLTKEEVREYLYTALSQIFTLGKVDYIKWDMNRTFSDIYSNNKAIRNMGEFNHRYILGLYALLNRLIKTFPKILFESCASGGNRFDLGMLSFMPQNWVSDDTDAYERLAIQEGTACGYPLSAMGCHVSAIPNHQTLRKSDLETRFNVAAFGNLGYELDMTKLSDFERDIIKDQIAFYKMYRNIFQYGTFVKLPSESNTTRWAVMDPQKANILILDYKRRLKPNPGLEILKVPITNISYTYEVYPRQQKLSIKDFGSLAENFIASSTGIENKKLEKVMKKMLHINTETVHYEVTGEYLAKCGIHLPQTFGGTGYDPHLTRVMPDGGSRIYLITRKK